MKEQVIICNDDGFQLAHNCTLGRAEQSTRDWVDFFLLECHVDVFAFCTASPDMTRHDAKVGEPWFSRMERAVSQSELHGQEVMSELRASGTDLLAVVADQVHQRERTMIASVRMSDAHHQHGIYAFNTPKFMIDHPEWRIQHEDGSLDVALDYSFREVRAHRLAILTEIVEGWDVDGLELDFMRWCRHFPPHLAEERIPVMTAFVGQIRAMLDRVAADKGRDRLILGIRVPPTLRECGPIGLDPKTWVHNDWLDYLCPSDYMWLDYGLRTEEYAEFCQSTRCGVYPCVNPFAAEWVDGRATNAYTPMPVNFNRRVFFSAEHFRGALRNYYAWGADGISTFNFCCETMDNPQFVRRAHDVVAERKHQVLSAPASYFYLPLWRQPKSPSLADQTWRSLRFGREALNRRLSYPFRMADGMNGEPLSGRMRFRVYNLHDNDVLRVDLNGVEIPKASVIERRKTNIHIAPDTRCPGMHVPSHVAYEIDLGKCPPLRGDNELGLTLQYRSPLISGECMFEALEIDVGWNGHPQMAGYVMEPLI